MIQRSRREFLHETFSACSAFGVTAALHALGARLAYGEEYKTTDSLVPVADETTGLELLRLPAGFRYRSYGWSGDLMSDGAPTPTEHDGMGVVQCEDQIVKLVRNHERSGHGDVLRSDRTKAYDPEANGGCTTLTFDLKNGEWKESWTSLAGTSRNCAGGITPWGTWLSCEETVMGTNAVDHYKDDVQRTFQKTHGWIFEVDPDGVSEPMPLKDMGRFVHEAVAIDQETGIVYETEDRGTSGFYRFLPNEPGNLAAGGQLEVAEVVGFDDLRKNAPREPLSVRWHAVPEASLPNSKGVVLVDELAVFRQGKQKGSTTFARLEGCWFGNGKVYFDATSGGNAEAGQIWMYDPSSEQLQLIFESPAKHVLNMPDNLCVNPAGGLVLCEDNDYGVDEYPQRVFTLSQDGQLRLLAQNNVRLNGEKNGFSGDFRNKEWAGATFSPDGRWLFVNIQTPGITFAITGPWDDVLA